MAFALGVPEVVEAGREHVSQAREAADVAAEVAAIGRVQAVGLHHQRHGVPAHVGAQAPFQFQVAGAALFVAGLDGVHVAGVGRERHVDAVLPRVLQQLLQQEVRTLRAFRADDRRQCIQPFTRFLGVGVGGVVVGAVLG